MMQAPTRQFSLVQDSGAYQSSCGYCNDDDGPLTSTAHGMHAYRLTVYDYQELLDQGWRRSGKYLYKPDNELTCCRQYTIRLDVTDYQASKAHKKLLRKWDRFLAGELQHPEEHQEEQQQQQQQQSDAATSSQRQHKRIRQASSSGGATMADAPADQQQQQHSGSQDGTELAPGVQQLLQQALDEAVQAWSSAAGQQLSAKGLPPARVVVPPANKQKHLPAGTALTSCCAFAVAAAARKQQQAAGATPAASLPWTCAEELANALAAAFNSLAAAPPQTPVSATAARGHINFSITQQLPPEQQHQQQAQQPPQQHRKARSSQEQQHDSSSQQQQQQQQQGRQQQGQQQQQQQQQQQGRGQPHRLEVRMVPNAFIQEEFDLYVKYQVSQHHDEPSALTPARYKNFLVDSPLIPVPPGAPPPAPAAPAVAAGGGGGTAAADGDAPACGYGSFHQQYWLDGRLVAVGVVDVLPRCLSSKYFFWDPAHAWLALGRYGALREISWVQQAHAAGASGLRYYYMGYYIHACAKMSYKAEYAPSELLCPQRQVWVAINDTVLRALDEQPYVVLSGLPGVAMRPNLSVPRPVPAQPPPQQQEQQQEQPPDPRRGLDSQLLFLLKQPVRWGALRESGMLDERQIRLMEERLTDWRAVVGETASHLLYATPSDLLPIV